eukprot:384951-Pyramimonas_sp.AAC.1
MARAFQGRRRLDELLPREIREERRIGETSGREGKGKRRDRTSRDDASGPTSVLASLRGPPE